jgi:N-acetylglucosaminyldiphosphoundecaprenol N-acetyl-beta-D-mannosaminyltransferase
VPISQSNMSKTDFERITFMGCPLDVVTPDKAADRAIEWCRGARRPHTLVTVNAAMLVMMQSDPALARACCAGDLIVADGVPVVWASRLATSGLPSRVAGVDLMANLLRRGSEARLSAFFLGAKEDVVVGLARLCEDKYPGLRVAGYRNGYFGEKDYQDVIGRIGNSGADMLFVGMPTPFKEIWCEEHRDELGVPLIMGVGGSFDVLTGRIRRAPVLLQNLGMEWFWRLAMEPRKMWKRYLICNSRFIGTVARLTFEHQVASRFRSSS